MATIGPFSPSKGLNNRGSIFTIPQNQATVLTDAFPVYGNIKNRTSVSKLNSVVLSKTLICGLTTWIDAAQLISGAGTNYPTVVAVATDGATKKIFSGVITNGPVATFSDVTGTATLNAATCEYYQFASLNGILVGTGNSFHTEKPFKITTYNGTAAALGGTPPSANCVCVANNFMFLAKDLSSSSLVSRVTWSAVQDPETWPAASHVDFRLNDGDVIQALANFQEDLIIFKQRSIGRLATTTISVSGTVTLGPLTTISTSVGCRGADAIDKLPDGRIIFKDMNNHVRIFDGSSNIMDLSDQVNPSPSIQTLLDQDGGVGAAGVSGLESIRVHPWKNQVWVTTEQNQMVMYNFLENTWAQTTLQSSPLCVSPPPVPSTAAATLLLAGDLNGFVWVLEQGSNGPSDMSSANNTPNITMSIPLPPDFIPRTLLIPATLGSGGALTVTLGFNGTLNSSSSSAIVRSNNPLWNLVDIRQNVKSPGRPLTMQVQIQVTAGKTFTIYPFFISDEVLSNFS